jgi:hypothetical protein
LPDVLPRVPGPDENQYYLTSDKRRAAPRMRGEVAGHRMADRGGEDVPKGDRFFDGNSPEPPRSALGLRLVLALIGVLLFVFIAIMLVRLDVPVLLILVPLLFALVGLVDLGIVITRLPTGRR